MPQSGANSAEIFLRLRYAKELLKQRAQITTTGSQSILRVMLSVHEGSVGRSPFVQIMMSVKANVVKLQNHLLNW
jgi:hypothetical protein